jgi:hypothetical protein
VLLLQLRNSASVVGVMMRHQDVVERPAGGLQCGFDGRGFGRVDRGGAAGLGVADQDPVIVLQAREQFDFGWHFKSSSIPSASAKRSTSCRGLERPVDRPAVIE